MGNENMQSERAKNSPNLFLGSVTLQFYLVEEKVENSSMLSGRDERNLNPFSGENLPFLPLVFHGVWCRCGKRLLPGFLLHACCVVCTVHTHREKWSLLPTPYSPWDMASAWGDLGAHFFHLFSFFPFFSLIWGARVGLLQLLGNKAVFKVR